MTDWIDDAEKACGAATEGPAKATVDGLNGMVQRDLRFADFARTALPRALAALRAADALVKQIEDSDMWLDEILWGDSANEFMCVFCEAVHKGGEPTHKENCTLATYRKALV